MTVIKKKTFSYLSHNRKSGTIAGLLVQFGRIGRAKGVETYFAFNPFCEKKNEKLAQWSGLSTSFLSYAGQQKKDYPQVRFSPTLEKVLSFLLALSALVYLSETGEWSHHPLGLP